MAIRAQSGIYVVGRAISGAAGMATTRIGLCRMAHKSSVQNVGSEPIVTISKENPAKIGNFPKVWQSRCAKLGFGEMAPMLNDGGEPVYALAQSTIEAQGENDLSGHDFPRSAEVRRAKSRASWLSERVARDITGHKTRSVFDRYAIFGARPHR